MFRTIKLSFIEIKKPFAFLENKGIKSTCVWFKAGKDTIASWQDSKNMTPRWCLAVYDREEAIGEIKRVLEDSDNTWKLLSTTAPELKSFVKIDERKKIGLL